MSTTPTLLPLASKKEGNFPTGSGTTSPHSPKNKTKPLKLPRAIQTPRSNGGTPFQSDTKRSGFYKLEEPKEMRPSLITREVKPLSLHTKTKKITTSKSMKTLMDNFTLSQMPQTFRTLTFRDEYDTFQENNHDNLPISKSPSIIK